MFADTPEWKGALQKCVYVHRSTWTCKSLLSNLLNQGLPAFSCLSPFLVREGLHSFDVMREVGITRICSKPVCYQTQCQSLFSRLRSPNYFQIWLFLQLLLNRLFPEVPLLGVILKVLFLLDASKCSAFMRCFGLLTYFMVQFCGLPLATNNICPLHTCGMGVSWGYWSPLSLGPLLRGTGDWDLGFPAFWLKSNRSTPSGFPVFHREEINSSDRKFLETSFPKGCW